MTASRYGVPGFCLIPLSPRSYGLWPQILVVIHGYILSGFVMNMFPAHLAQACHLSFGIGSSVARFPRLSHTAEEVLLLAAGTLTPPRPRAEVLTVRETGCCVLALLSCSAQASLGSQDSSLATLSICFALPPPPLSVLIILFYPYSSIYTTNLLLKSDSTGRRQSFLNHLSWLVSRLSS